MERTNVLKIGISLWMLFMASCGFFWWQQRGTAAWVSAPAKLAPEAAEGADPQGRDGPPDTGARAAAPSAPVPPSRPMVAAPARPAVAAESPVDPSRDEGPALPILFNVVPTEVSMRENGDQGPYVLKRVYETILTNTSDEQLDLTIIETNLPTMQSTSAQVVLAGGNQKHLGIEQGLAMVSGDRLTVRSGGFSAASQMIP